jgi:hypothetical protein
MPLTVVTPVILESLKKESLVINKSNTSPVEATPTDVVDIPVIIPKSPS